jgi:purine-binding chemotaxis protein CheW
MTMIKSIAEGRATPGLKSPSTDLLRLVVFYLADQPYALAVEEVREIIPLPEMTRPPVCPVLLRGFVNISGVPLPVISGSRLFDLPEPSCDLYTPLLLLAIGQDRMALLVDRVSQIVSVSRGDIAPVGADHSLNECATGVLRLDGTNILILSAARLLLEKEQACLTALQATEQARLRSLEVNPA